MNSYPTRRSFPVSSYKLLRNSSDGELAIAHQCKISGWDNRHHRGTRLMTLLGLCNLAGVNWLSFGTAQPRPLPTRWVSGLSLGGIGVLVRLTQPAPC